MYITQRNNADVLLNFTSILMLILSLFSLIIITFEGTLAPIFLFIQMLAMGSVLIISFSDDELFTKLKIFIFFFSFYLFYIMLHDYILISLSLHRIPFDYLDEATFYYYSDLALPYISGKKNFIDLFSFASYPMNDLPVHVMFSALISYYSNLIDGSNSIIIQKLLSPFLGGIFSVVLYSTLKYQFKNRIFVLNATFAYGLLSAVFMYSTLLLRDIDVTLTYMIFIYLFLQKNSFINFLFLFFIAFITVYLRVESGMVLFGLTLLYSYLYVINLQSRSIKFIFSIILILLFTFILFLMANKILGIYIGLNEGNTAKSVAEASSTSIGVLLNKFPFPLNYVVKMLFGQLQPFPFFMSIDRPAEAISGIFWPFIFIMMIYAVMKKDIRVLIDTKVKYLLVVAIAILFLMSSEPMARRMMSVYPIIYMTSLYVFLIIPKNNIKKILYYYILGIVSLNTFYYLIKL